jgi:hypothetical protein
MVKDIYGSWAGTWNGCCGVGMEVDLMKMISMLDVSREVCLSLTPCLGLDLSTCP